jgi:hypothetical protein
LTIIYLNVGENKFSAIAIKGYGTTFIYNIICWYGGYI